MSDNFEEQINENLIKAEKDYHKARMEHYKEVLENIKKERELRATNLKKIRLERGYSQAKLSELSGVNLRMIQHYEQGVKDINLAQANTLYKLAQVLECNMEELLELN